MARSSARVAAVIAAAAGLAMVSPAVAQAATHSAPATVVNLIKDPGAEAANPNSSGGKVKLPSWTVSKRSQLTAVAYGTSGGFPTSSSPGPKKRGKNFFVGGPSGNSSNATQTAGLRAYSGLIGSGRAKFKLSAYLGGFQTESDFATLTVTWKNAGGGAIGHTTIGPVTKAQRKGVTGMLFRSKSGSVPRGAAKALITLRMVRKNGVYIDGFADNLSLTIS
jgi:hypothetical protein